VAKTERLVFDWQRGHSEASKKGWQGRWERGEGVGPKGKAYLERQWGAEIPPEEEDFQDYWDMEIEY